MTTTQPVIVTGASGLIGSRVIDLAPTAFTLIGFDNHGPPVAPVRAESVPVDLTSDDGVDRALERVRYAYGPDIASVIHLAAYYDFSGDDSPLYDTLTVQGTQRLLDGLNARGFRVGQFIFSSTMLVHAPTEPGRPITETSPIDAKWPYPESKVKAEETLLARRGRIPAVILRIAGVYDDACHSIPLAHQIQRIRERRLTGRVYPGDTSRGQSFVHLDDVVSAIWLAVQQRSALPDPLTLLIGEPETLSYDELQRTFARLIHGDDDWDTRQIPKPVAQAGAWVQDALPGEDPFIKPWMIGLADDHYELDITRAQRTLGWRPKHSLRATLPAMIRSLKSNPEAWYHDNKLEPAPEPAESHHS